MPPLLVTFCVALGGIGFVRHAPGTWASLFTTVLAYYANWSGSTYLFLCLSSCSVGYAALHFHLKRHPGSHDPGYIVIDEWSGQLIALGLIRLALPSDVYHTHQLLLMTGGFIGFRLFDIAKPLGIGWLDRHLKGPLGILADDILAGFYAGIAVLFLAYVSL